MNGYWWIWQISYEYHWISIVWVLNSSDLWILHPMHLTTKIYWDHFFLLFRWYLQHSKSGFLVTGCSKICQKNNTKKARIAPTVSISKLCVAVLSLSLSDSSGQAKQTSHFNHVQSTWHTLREETTVRLSQQVPQLQRMAAQRFVAFVYLNDRWSIAGLHLCAKIRQHQCPKLESPAWNVQPWEAKSFFRSFQVRLSGRETGSLGQVSQQLPAEKETGHILEPLGFQNRPEAIWFTRGSQNTLGQSRWIRHHLSQDSQDPIFWDLTTPYYAILQARILQNCLKMVEEKSCKKKITHI